MLLAVEVGTLATTDGAEPTIAAGGGALWPAGTDRSLRNADNGLAVLLVLTVAADAWIPG